MAGHEHPETPREGWPAWRTRLHEVIFEADTRAGFVFDAGLMACIVASVAVVMLASVPAVNVDYARPLFVAEWVFTVLFTVEYGLRLLSVKRPLRYARSFFGLVDLLAILPTWATLVITGTEPLMVIRVLRLLRVFRVFKLVNYLRESNVLAIAMYRSRRKVGVFLATVLMMVTILGTLVYVIEGAEAGFTSIPVSIYWAIVTVTTVGYGDISPVTPLGRFVAACAMILGYAIIAVPTGIVSVEIAEAARADRATRTACPACATEGHPRGARFCFDCGEALDGDPPVADPAEHG